MLIAQRYQLQDKLGEGGSAEVWRALDIRMDKLVAVKLLHPFLPPMEQSRLTREARALSRLSHPGVVQVFDLGQHEGRAFFVMELVEGGGFDQLGPFEQGLEGVALLDACIKTLEALAYLHQKGVIHRDLTPRNILLTAQGQPKIMDFGLAYIAEESRHTRTGYTLGTPQYMAPEQAKGLALTGQADVYSFGAVMYKLLTKKNLFTAENDQAMLYQHVYESPRPINHINPAIPQGVADLVANMLSKDPLARPSCVAAAKYLLIELARFVQALTGVSRAGATRSGHYVCGPVRPHLLESVGFNRSPTIDLTASVSWPSELLVQDAQLWLTSDENLLRVDVREGSIARLRMNAEISTPLLLLPHKLYLGTSNGRLWGVNKSLKTISSFPTKDTLAAAPTLAGLLFVASHDGYVYALQEDHTLEWGFQVADHVTVSPTLYRGLLFVVSDGGWLFALDPLSGALRYKVEVGAMHANPVGSGGALLLCTWDGEVHAFNPLSREVLWSFAVDGQIWGTPAADGQAVYVGHWGKESSLGAVVAICIATGEELWETPVGKVTAAVSLAHGYCYAVTEEGGLYVLDAKNGRVVCEATGLGSVVAPALFFEDAVLVATLEGKLYRFAEVASAE